MFLPSFPQGPSNNFQFFGPSNDISTNLPRGLQLWQKPAGIQWVWMLGVGGGGAGGAGNPTAATARTGGGGGASGCLSAALIPAFMLPDTLFIWAGQGGKGAAAGESSFVSPQPVATAAVGSVLLLAVGGSNGTTSAAGGVSTQNPSGNLTGCAFQINQGNAAGGAPGANTGAAVAAVSRSALLIPFTGGAGGGGSSAANTVVAGGNITGLALTSGANIYPLISGGTAGVSGTTAGGNGNDGHNRGLSIAAMMAMINRGQSAFTFSGGAGGGAGGASNGGNGGKGAWGCGGGGGGAGGAAGTGGDGGDGFVIIGGW